VLRRGPDQRKASRKPPSDSTRRAGSASRSKGRGGEPGRTNGDGRKKPAAPLSTSPFVLYVEGARDREILAHWARRVDPEVTRLVERQAVILGGRRPARAISDFRKRGGSEAGLVGLIVLDRDDHDEGSLERGASADLEGLEVFIWSRRHIESYLLVPAALRRLVGLDPEDRRIERFVEAEQRSTGSLHAKRILGTGGSLSEVLGTRLGAGEIARAMRREELHQDIIDLFESISRVAGLSSSSPEVVVRSRPVLERMNSQAGKPHGREPER
jgi:hypothetical protein